jgi:hypothetical protein
LLARLSQLFLQLCGNLTSDLSAWAADLKRLSRALTLISAREPLKTGDDRGTLIAAITA